MKKLSGNSYSLIVVMAVMLVVLGLSLRLEHAAARMLPLLMSSIVFILAAIELRREIAARGDTEENSKIEGRKYLPIAAWILGFSLAIYLVGFIIAIPLFVGCYMKQHGSRWLMAITSAVVYTAIIYSVFELALRVDLYKGLLFS